MLAELQTVDRWRVKRLDGFCALQQRRVRRKFADGTIYVDRFHHCQKFTKPFLGHGSLLSIA